MVYKIIFVFFNVLLNPNLGSVDFIHNVCCCCNKTEIPIANDIVEDNKKIRRR